MTTVGGIVAALADRFPLAWAEAWDRVGLLVGDGESVVERVLVTLDADERAVTRAMGEGADLIVTHHPPFLDDVEDLTPGAGGRAAAWRAVTSGIAIASFHTNLDRSPEGARALPDALGYEAGEPIESGTRPAALVTTFAPPERAQEIRDAMASAGGGRVGAYEQCSFSGAGVGRFLPRSEADPAVGHPGVASEAGEERVEMVCERSHASAVMAAAAASHPYEEPVVVGAEVVVSRGSQRLGRVCAPSEGTTLHDLGGRAAEALGARPRVWGDPLRSLSRIAFANGSASSLLPDVLASGADALVCGEVRYHAAQEAAAAGLAIVEAGHDASEWPLVGVLSGAVRDAIDGRQVDVVTAAFDPCWWMWGEQ